MSFIAHYAAGDVQTVHITHVAPQLFRVQPLAENEHGELISHDYYYVENGVELARVCTDNGSVASVEEMPHRSFYMNDVLTASFLRDLAEVPGTVVLDGSVNGIDVIYLRQDASAEIPYSITVGLDVRNWFPVYLLVTDRSGQDHVYYEMEAIEYYTASELDPALFVIPAEPEARMNIKPPANILDSDKFTAAAPQGQVSVQRDTTWVNYDLPLFPFWLPDNYLIEGVHLLDYPVKGQQPSSAASDTQLVYQFDIFGAGRGDIISLFQTQAENLDLRLPEDDDAFGSGYVVANRQGWLVVAMGNLPTDTLMRIIDNLDSGTNRVANLLELTRARDQLLEAMGD